MYMELWIADECSNAHIRFNLLYYLYAHAQISKISEKIYESYVAVTARDQYSWL